MDKKIRKEAYITGLKQRKVKRVNKRELLDFIINFIIN